MPFARLAATTFSRWRLSRRFLLVVFVIAASPGSRSLLAADAAPNQKARQKAQVEFFETHVRPVFVKHCVECHGPTKQESGLRLDSREGLLKGGDGGAAIVAGRPEESVLIEAVRHEGLEMPPEKKLDDNLIAALEKWVR